MRNVNTKMCYRWTVASALLIMPLAAGCGSKTDAPDDVPTALPPQVGQQDVAAPDIEPTATPDEPKAAGSQVPLDVPPDANIVADKPFAETPSDDTANEDEADPPKSLFRSIGRALTKGVTDAMGATSNSSPEESDPDEPKPKEPEPKEPVPADPS